MSSVKTTQLDGDVSVGRNTAIGGSLTIQGGGRVKGTFVVDGWLDAKNIKGPNKGIFTTVEKLREAFPRPHDGWWAIVGKSLPSPIYVGDGGAWVATGESGGTPMLEDTNGALQQAIDDAKNKANEAKKAIEDMVSSLPIAQEAGDSATKVMSQKAVTELVKKATDDKSAINEIARKFPFNSPSSLRLENKYISQSGELKEGSSEWGVEKYDISTYNSDAFVESAARNIAYLYAIYKNGSVVEVGKQLSSEYFTELIDCSKGDTLYVQSKDNTPITPVWKGVYNDLDSYTKSFLGKKEIIDLKKILIGGTNTNKRFFNKTLEEKNISTISIADKYACGVLDVSKYQGKTLYLNTYGVVSEAWDSFVDNNNAIVSQFQHRLPKAIVIPDNATKLYLTTSYGKDSEAQGGETFNYNDNDYPRVIVHYEGLIDVVEENYKLKTEIESLKSSSKEDYDLNVAELHSYIGDTMQLFKYPLTLRANYNSFNLNVAIDTTNNSIRKQGKNLERYFEFTPATAGEYIMRANIIRPDLFVLQQDTFKVIVKEPTNPSSVKNILLIGDSETQGLLNNSGVQGSENGVSPYATELKRLLQTTDGTPRGVGLTNVRLIGTQNIAGGRHEGYGGWNANSFMSVSSPFFVGGKIDFNAYLEQDKVYDDATHKGVDVIYILLGANGGCTSSIVNGKVRFNSSPYRNSVKLLLNKIKEQIKNGTGSLANPNIKVVLLNYASPYINGYGYHPYGSGELENGNFIAKCFLECWKVNEELINESDYNGWVFSALCATQVDSENGFVYMNKPLNNYTSDTEKVSLEQIHFNKSAYKQFAQAVLRDVIFRVCN